MFNFLNSPDDESVGIRRFLGVTMKKVLIVDDSELSVMLLKAMFQKLGFQVETASTAMKALIAAEQSEFDLITLDYHMPQIDGEECFNILTRRALDRGWAPKVVVISADDSQLARQTFHERGAQAYLSKPLRIGRLAEAMQEMFPFET